MDATSYKILDEPRPGTLTRFVVDPFWPLLAMMMAGMWLAGPWFIFNAFAIGSATRKSETWLVVAGLLTTVVALAALAALQQAGLLPQALRAYVPIAFAVIKLCFAYAIWMRQARSLALHTYFGGSTRNGALVLVGGVIARGVAVASAPAWLKLLMI